MREETIHESKTVDFAGDTGSELLTVPEVCAVLRVSKWTVQRLIQSRQLASVKIGRRRLVPITAVKNLLDQLRSQGAA